MYDLRNTAAHLLSWAILNKENPMKSRMKTLRLLALVAVLVGVMMLLAAPTQAQSSTWTGQFWNNRDLTGAPVVTRQERTIDFDWGHGSPQAGVNNDNFSARWTRTVNFAPGTYRFIATMDDGMRFFLNGRLLIDSWIESQERTLTTDVTLTGGNQELRIDYFDAGGVAIAKFEWVQIGGGGTGGGSGQLPGQFPNWRAEYFNNTTLAGPPALVRDDLFVNHNWGQGSPAPGIIGTDFFSARWTRTLDGNPGQYRISLTSDDGSRLFINNVLVIDNWNVQASTTRTANYFYPGGPVQVRVEYFEQLDNALINVQLALIPGTGGGGTIVDRPVTDSNGCTPVTGLWAYVNTSRLNFRTGPSTNFPVVATLSQCDLVHMTGFTNASRTWVETQLPGGGVGWANASFMVLGTPITQLTPR